MGVLLTHAAGYFEGKEVAQTQSYGPEARGGSCRTEVVISDEQIDYIKTINPDIFVAMSQPAFDKYIKGIDFETAFVLIDETLVKDVPEGIKKLYVVPATKLAEEKCNNGMVANTIMLCAVAMITKIINVDTLKSTISKQFPAKIRDVNLRAVDVTLDYYNDKERN